MSFINEDFLLYSKTAKVLFNNFAKDAPIFDWHCHLPPEQIANDHHFSNITELWLGGDHYKWRLMRLAGVDEKYITHEGSPKDKFLAYCQVMPQCCGNPVYHWSHLELKRFFNIDEELNAKNGELLWEKCNARIQEADFSARQLMLRSNVRYVCTSDDPADSLEHHQKLASDSAFPIKVFPAFRPDKYLNLTLAGFKEQLERLGTAAGVCIDSYENLVKALKLRIEYFHQNGARHSDHGWDVVRFVTASPAELNIILEKAITGQAISLEECAQWRSSLMLELAREYCKHHWVMQIHIGALRSINTRMLDLHGRDCGYDCSGDTPYLNQLAMFLDTLESEGNLTDTVLFSLSPNDDLALNNLAGCFPGDAHRAKVQLGPAWWLNDHIGGMRRQLTSFANSGVLATFIGMVTDSRSFLSYPRFEYFRRILCNFVGEMIDRSEFTSDLDAAGEIIRNICYNNAYAKYFGNMPR